MVLAQQLLEQFPGFFVGFDLVSQEDKGRPLIDFADIIINATTANPDLHLFFHAGETRGSKIPKNTGFLIPVCNP